MNPGSLEGHRPPFAKFRAILGCQAFVMNILPGAGTPPQGLSDKLARRSVAVFSQCTGLLQPTTLAPCPRLGRLPLIRPLRPQCPMSLPKLNRPQRADYSCERRKTERPAEWTPAPHLMRSGAWDTPVLTSENPRGTGLTPSGERLLFCPRTSLHAVCRSYR